MDFESAVDRHQRQVFTLASYLLSDRQDAEDVTQEVMLKLWDNRRRVAPAHLQAWLLRVTRNACYDRLRRRRTAARFEVGGFDERAADRPSPAPDPEARAGAAEFRSRVGRALSLLREPAKSIVVLREIEGLSYREIADVLELPMSTIRVALHRGRRRLREDLREEYHHVAAG